MKDNAYMPKKHQWIYKVDEPKENWKLTRPPRYVYHITKGGTKCESDEDLYYQRISIFLYGLYGKDKGRGGVWANRDLNQISRAYPFIIDGFGWSEDRFINEVEGHDIWRIDTTKLHNKWYLDPNMQDLPSLYDGYDYVYTEKSIPPFAMKLYNIKIDPVHYYLYSEESIKFKLVPIEIKSNRTLDL